VSAVTPEDREKAVAEYIEYLGTDGSDDPALTKLAHTDVYVIRTAFRAGWDACPGGARPTREALAGAIGRIPFGYSSISRIAAAKIADALLVADHLWTEQPSDDPIPHYAQLDIWMALGHDSQEYDSWRDSIGFAEAWARLCAEVRASSPAPVVDREALAQALHAISDEARFIWGEPMHEGVRRRFRAKADALFASGIFRDAAVFRASVEAEQRERLLSDAAVDAAARAAFEQGVGDWTWDDVLREEPDRAALWRDDARAVLAAAIRAGGTHERTEDDRG
jgi:hypothetical protein